MKSIVVKNAVRMTLLAVSFTGLLPTLANAQTNNLTKEKIEAALNEAYNKFKDLKEGKKRRLY